MEHLSTLFIFLAFLALTIIVIRSLVYGRKDQPAVPSECLELGNWNMRQCRSKVFEVSDLQKRIKESTRLILVIHDDDGFVRLGEYSVDFTVEFANDGSLRIKLCKHAFNSDKFAAEDVFRGHLYFLK